MRAVHWIYWAFWISHRYEAGVEHMREAGELLLRMKSLIGWIDFSDEDQKRAQDYLRSLSEGTLDELAFGIIRDGFADLFFPATSTIMTRARYFILVPSIYLHVLAQGDSGTKAKRNCERLELTLRKQLILNKSLEKTRKEEVKRYPASIYWAGLRRLGIVNRQVGSQAAYFDSMAQAIQRKVGVKDDDHNALEPDTDSEMWDAEIVRLFEAGSIPCPDETDQFDSSIDFKMTGLESVYLRQRFREAEKDSVVTNVFRKNSFVPASYPWQWDYPENLKTQIEHAQHFSMLTKIATLLYYQMLDSRRQANGYDGCSVDLMEAVETWWNQCRESVLAWDMEQFIAWIEANQLARGSDRNFLTKLYRLLGESGSSSELVQNTGDLIVYREKDKRPNKRRLIPGRFQNEWKLPTQRLGFFTDPQHVPYLLDFRSGIASQIMVDVYEGLGQ